MITRLFAGNRAKRQPSAPNLAGALADTRPPAPKDPACAEASAGRLAGRQTGRRLTQKIFVNENSYKKNHSTKLPSTRLGASGAGPFGKLRASPFGKLRAGNNKVCKEDLPQGGLG